MGKLTLNLATTPDSFITDPDGGMDWILMGDERANYFVEAIKNVDTLMMGRLTYQGFLFWHNLPNNPNASALEKTIVPAEIQKLKEESEKNIRLDGSASLVQQLTKLELIDEYQCEFAVTVFDV